jgi:hypothetical protein
MIFSLQIETTCFLFLFLFFFFNSKDKRGEDATWQSFEHLWWWTNRLLACQRQVELLFFRQVSFNLKEWSRHWTIEHFYLLCLLASAFYNYQNFEILLN